jgi:hypothetical protein
MPKCYVYLIKYRTSYLYRGQLYNLTSGVVALVLLISINTFLATLLELVVWQIENVCNATYPLFFTRRASVYELSRSDVANASDILP